MIKFENTEVLGWEHAIRDYVEKKVAEIEERYRWIDAFY